MTTYVALLRGINVGGNKMVPMSGLRDLIERIGFQDGRSLLQSGNLVFRGRARASDGLERLLEAEAAKRLGVEADFFVRTAGELEEIVAGNPFTREAERDPGRLVTFFLKSAPPAAAVKMLQSAIVGREVVSGRGKEIYIVYPDGQGRSKLTGAVVEKRLGVRGTARNWNTVLKLRALAGGDSA